MGDGQTTSDSQLQIDEVMRKPGTVLVLADLINTISKLLFIKNNNNMHTTMIPSSLFLFAIQICTTLIVGTCAFQPITQLISMRQQSQLSSQVLKNQDASNINDYNAFDSFSRRNLLIKSISALTSLQYLVPLPKNANAASSTDLPNGLLETRVLENVLSPPPYEMECADIIYPSYFSGVWDVQSTTNDVMAPCGITLFGGNYTYNKARGEIGTTLTYKSRFILGGNDMIIADREYNVREIAKSVMGSNSVLDVPLATPNKVSAILSPAGANQIFQADLLTLNRRSENISPCEFHCSEVVRQIIAPAKISGSNPVINQPMSPSRSSSLLKEIETTSLYLAVRGGDESVKEILCKQRSATFLLPSQQDPLAYKMWEMSRGRPIDVRFYDIVYRKKDIT